MPDPSGPPRGPCAARIGTLGEARVLGLDRVLIVCEAGNVASAKTIERHGGVPQEIRDTKHGPMRRYWIKTGKPGA